MNLKTRILNIIKTGLMFIGAMISLSCIWQAIEKLAFNNSATQNTQLLNLLKQGKLIKP